MPMPLTTLAADHTHKLPVSPYVVGVSIFLFFCLAMAALLMFGKGRPHA
ncbi:MAG: hypothetical protein QOI51_1668 [Nocardioidaceae bacterium]|jgi:hypothetical protein|nr:hypothetical protein [Nocardioidaceae bacterium]MDX6307629.1 hypothetical protein [Nocardioidaceae bacterium]